MTFETGVPLSQYRWAHLLLALPVGILERAYILFCQFTSRISVEGEVPAESIVFFIHRDYYLSILVTKPFLAAVKGDIVWLGYHGFYSYIPWLWFLGEKVRVCRYHFNSGKKPFHFILDYMKEHPRKTYVQYTDSGGPYGRVRESLVRLAQEMGRPVVACRIHSSAYVTIHHHNFPLPFAKIRLCFASPVPVASLKDVAEGREIIQTQLDSLS